MYLCGDSHSLRHSSCLVWEPNQSELFDHLTIAAERRREDRYVGVFMMRSEARGELSGDVELERR